MSRPAVFAAVLAVILWTEVSGFGFQLDNETIAAETYKGRDFVSMGLTKSGPWLAWVQLHPQIIRRTSFAPTDI